MWIKEIVIPFLIQIFKEILGAQSTPGGETNQKVALKISLALNILFFAMSIFVIERFFVNAQKLSIEQAEIKKMVAVETQLETALKDAQLNVIYYRKRVDDCLADKKMPTSSSYKQPVTTVKPQEPVRVINRTPKKLSADYVRGLMDSINKS